MAHVGTTSTRMRDEDYEVAKAVTDDYPVFQIVDVLAAWRRLWERSSRTARLAALKQVPRVRRGRRPSRAA